jgi:hypothetical protein
MKTTSAKPVRCAIYTRVSTEQGLEQDFNSLDAQYDAPLAYIRSQAHAGWALLRGAWLHGIFFVSLKCFSQSLIAISRTSSERKSSPVSSLLPTAPSMTVPLMGSPGYGINFQPVGLCVMPLSSISNCSGKTKLRVAISCLHGSKSIGRSSPRCCRQHPPSFIRDSQPRDLRHLTARDHALGVRGRKPGLDHSSACLKDADGGCRHAERDVDDCDQDSKPIPQIRLPLRRRNVTCSCSASFLQLPGSIHAA